MVRTVLQRLSAMPRFFLNVLDYGESIADDEGECFDHVLAARSHALTIMQELLLECVWSREAQGECYVTILDANGLEVARVDIWEAVDALTVQVK